jgi:hypothetical protein
MRGTAASVPPMRAVSLSAPLSPGYRGRVLGLAGITSPIPCRLRPHALVIGRIAANRTCSLRPAEVCARRVLFLPLARCPTAGQEPCGEACHEDDNGKHTRVLHLASSGWGRHCTDGICSADTRIRYSPHESCTADGSTNCWDDAAGCWTAARPLQPTRNQNAISTHTMVFCILPPPTRSDYRPYLASTTLSVLGCTCWKTPCTYR